MVDAKEGPALRPALLSCDASLLLRSQLADARRPVRRCASRAGAVARSATRAQNVVAGPSGEERPAPVGVVAGVGDVLAGDPDRVTVHRCGAVVAPARADPGREPRLLVTREPVIRGSAGATRHDVPRADTGECINRRIAGARVL